MEEISEVLVEQPAVVKPPRKKVVPDSDGTACLFVTSHAVRRLNERFGLKTLKQTPFSIYTLYCEATDIDRPCWALRVSNGKREGFLVGRWELANPNLSRGYKYWFTGTTVLTKKQFEYSKLVIRKSVKINVRRIILERHNDPLPNDTSTLTSTEESAMVQA